MSSNTRRPDPITGKVTTGALLGAAGGGGLGVIIDLLTHTPPGSAWLEWLQWALTLAGAVLAVWAQAQRAKRETTPLASPQLDDGTPLVPGERHEAGFFDDDPAEEPPV